MRRLFGTLTMAIALAAFALTTFGAALAAGADRLYIGDAKLYPGMEQTYGQGYRPTIADDKAIVVIPLTGRPALRTVGIKADLGAAADSPFEFVNLSQTISGRGPYVFTLTIPLKQGRVNGAYPVAFTVEYADSADVLVTQQFTVYVVITDGYIGDNRKPELLVRHCDVDQATVEGDTEFTAEVVIENIGELPAQSVRITYGGVDNEAIVPSATNNLVFVEQIASGETATASIKLKTTKDVRPGNPEFYIALNYIDAQGAAYSATRQFAIRATQQARIGCDPITAPEAIEAGETMKLRSNVFNLGRCTLRNVTARISGAGLMPVSSLFLGDIAPGEAKYGELEVFIGMLSMTEGYGDRYGKTNGTYTITYTDDIGQERATTQKFTTEILAPSAKEDADAELTDEPAFQWWVTILVGLAIIAIMVSSITVTRIARAIRLK